MEEIHEDRNRQIQKNLIEVESKDLAKREGNEDERHSSFWFEQLGVTIHRE